MDQGQDSAEVISGVSCRSLRAQTLLSLAAHCVVWRLKPKGGEGEKGRGVGAALRVEGTGQCLGHRHTQSVILEGAPAWEEAELRGRKTAEGRAERGAGEQG